VTPLLLGALLLGAPFPRLVRGVVYDDLNANGRRDPGEPGLPGVAVSDGVNVVTSLPDGSYELECKGGSVFVILPGDRKAIGSFYHPCGARVDFALSRGSAQTVWRFAHLADTHLHAGNVARLRRALGLAEDRKVDFAFLNGDLIKDALAADEPTAKAQFAFYVAEMSRAAFGVWNVLGNHDLCGLERPGGGPPDPKAAYEESLGPRYYAFNRGKLHFLVLDTIGVDGRFYYGVLDTVQLAWIERELAFVAPGTTLVTVGHIPLRSGRLSSEFDSENGKTLLTVAGKTFYRHIVRNVGALEDLLRPFRWTLALQGHTHSGEKVQGFDGGTTRYHTAPAVDRQPWAAWPGGIVTYEVRGDIVDDGELATIDPE